MDYDDCIKYLFGLSRHGLKLGLENILNIIQLLDYPHNRYRIIHIAGTNGKGSTASFLHSMLTKAGYKTGLYTSPHLNDFSERIRFCETPISHTEIIELTGHIRSVCRQSELSTITFFEFTTAMALYYFARCNADFVVIETGLGGAFDATNIVNPDISVITDIALDHQQYLGQDVRSIAVEKAGIIKRATPVVCGSHARAARSVVMDICNQRSAPLVMLGKDFFITSSSASSFVYTGYGSDVTVARCGLPGRHQHCNATLAIAVCRVLQDAGCTIATHALTDGIADASWPGRFEIVKQSPTVVLDGAHNTSAVDAFLATLVEMYPDRSFVFVAGFSHDKNIGAMINRLRRFSAPIIFCKSDTEKSADRSDIEKYISFSADNEVWWIPHPYDALTYACSKADEKTVICVTGSLFVVGAVRQAIVRNKEIVCSGRIAM